MPLPMKTQLLKGVKHAIYFNVFVGVMLVVAAELRRRNYLDFSFGLDEIQIMQYGGLLIIGLQMNVLAHLKKAVKILNSPKDGSELR
jgi:hypothetical protein